MNPLTCIIVDDEQYCIDMLAEYVRKTDFLQLVYSSTNPLDAVQWLSSNTAAVCFTDVKMPKLNGIDFVKTLHGRCRFILCTAHPHYALEGFENDVIDYLLKPVTYPRFLKAVQKALQLLAPPAGTPAVQSDGIFVGAGKKGSLIKIAYADIVFIEAAKNFVTVYTSSGKITAYTNLTELEATLPRHLFMRVHNSYIVSLQRIVKFESEGLSLRGTTETIPVSRNNRDALLAVLTVIK
jgi:two-component system, LytTR family, response regulator